MKQKEFCRLQGISYYKFKYWKKKRFNKNHNSEIKTKETELSAARFIPMEIQTQPKPATSVTKVQINYPNGISVHFNSEIELEQLQSLIKSY